MATSAERMAAKRERDLAQGIVTITLRVSASSASHFVDCAEACRANPDLYPALRSRSTGRAVSLKTTLTQA